MTKLIIHSNAPWAPTGYGMQTATLARCLKEHYDLAISTFYGLEGAPITWEGIPVLPGLGGQFGLEGLIQHAEKFFGGDRKGGIVVTLMDVWVLDPTLAQELRMACWTPVDHAPPPPRVVTFLIDSGAVPIAMSRFGEEMLRDLDPLYVPHAIDTDVYKRRNKKAIREKGGFPEDAFLVGMVAANKGRPSRKGFQEAFQAFARLLAAHENAYLYLHTNVSHNYANGENLTALLESLQIPQDKVRIADQYSVMYSPYSQKDMAQLYSAMDVLLNPSKGEGFGIPIIEAQACGTPVIVTDFTAMPELCGAGWTVRHTPYWTGLESWEAHPDVDDIVSALEECYAMSPAQREKMATTARRHALQYDVRRVFKEHWVPTMREVEKRLLPSVERVAA
jgi:glycosyltransferase involved in cell wall biosynthesis